MVKTMLQERTIKLGHEKHAHLTPEAPKSDPAIVQACRDEGYAVTRRTDAYQAAYDEAKLRNASFQRGITDGGSDGFAIGIAAGQSAGYTDGLANGDASGYDAGYADAYSDGYDAGFADYCPAP